MSTDFTYIIPLLQASNISVLSLVYECLDAADALPAADLIPLSWLQAHDLGGLQCEVVILC